MSFLGIMLMLAACSSDTFINYTGNMPSEERIGQLAKGQSKQEVMSLLGSPSCVVSLNQDTWIYMSSAIKQVAFMPPEEIDRKLLVIKFNDQNNVEVIEHLDKENGEEIAISEDASANQEKEQGFFQKYFGGVGQVNPFGTQARPNN